MDGSPDGSSDRESVAVGALPDTLTGGGCVLVASAGDPTDHDIDLQVLCRYGNADDTALVVTTTDGADRTVETYDRLCSSVDRPALELVDTTAQKPSVSAPYGDPPTVVTPSPGDLERLVMALSELAGPTPPSNGTRHFVVRSLTPILERAPTDRVCSVLARITGLRSDGGLCLLGIDYTAHDEETMAAVTDRVDGVLWVKRVTADGVDLEYRSARDRYGPSVSGSETRD